MRMRGLAAVGLLAVFMSGCSPEPKSSDRSSATGCEISDYGSGVYYFHCSGGFGATLAEFRGKHKVVSVTSYTLNGVGTMGYWVVTE